MSAEPVTVADDRPPLERVIHAYFQAVDAGQSPDPQAVIDQHPDLADELRAFFSGQTRITDALGAVPHPFPASIGEYEILSVLGVGGMGVVFKARHRGLQRVVALKMMRDRWTADPADVQRFVTEAENMAQLDHSHVLPIYEVGRQDGHPYFTMKLVEGGHLGEQLASVQKDPRRIAHLVATVARGVHHAHQRGLLHRDLKPANILIDAEGNAFVTDFGLARKIEGEGGQTTSGAVVGTPEYMAPEQALASKRLTTSVDVYGLGAVLYSALTGHPPFRAEGVLETLRQVTDTEPVRPRLLNPTLDRDLETICLKCLEKEPRKRYGSAEAVAEDLERWLKGEPILARPSSVWERTYKWAKRRPAAAALGGGVLLAVVVFVVALVVSNHFTEEALRREQRIAYLNRIALAARELEAESVGRAEELLDACVPRPGQVDLRGWEWRYLMRLRHEKPLSFPTEHGLTFGITFSPDGKSLATSGLTGLTGGAIKLWDLQGEAVTLKKTHVVPRDLPFGLTTKGLIYRPAFAPNGYLALSGAWPGLSGFLEVWDPEADRVVWQVNKYNHFWLGLAYSPKGQRLASVGPDHLVRIWTPMVGGEPLELRGHSLPVNDVAWSPDGQRLVSGGDDGTVVIWDSLSGKIHHQLKGHGGTVLSVAFSPDGRRVASAGFDSTIRFWDAEAGRPLPTLRGLNAPVSHIAFSPDGERLASAGWDKTVKVWDAQSGDEVLTLRGHADVVSGVAWSQDSQRLASIDWAGVARVWDASPPSADAPGKPLRLNEGLEGGMMVLAFDPVESHHRFAVGNLEGNLSIHDVNAGRPVRRWKAHEGSVTGVAFNNDGTRLASVGVDRKVAVWDPKTGMPLVVATEGETLWSVAFSPDGEWLATCGWDKTAKIRSAKSLAIIKTLKGHLLPVLSVAFSPDSQIVATGSTDTTVILWDRGSGRQLRTLRDHAHFVHGVVFSPDGCTLATACWDHKVRLWDATTGDMLHAMEGHTDHVVHVEFSPDGRFLASAGTDAKVRVWDVEKGKETALLSHHVGSVSTIGFSPDGKTLASGSHFARRGEVTLWDFDPRTGNLGQR